MDGIIHESMKFEGHMGINIIRPSNPSSPEYTIIFRFNTNENLTKWEKSEVRREWIEKGRSVTKFEPALLAYHRLRSLLENAEQMIS